MEAKQEKRAPRLCAVAAWYFAACTAGGLALFFISMKRLTLDYQVWNALPVLSVLGLLGAALCALLGRAGAKERTRVIAAWALFAVALIGGTVRYALWLPQMRADMLGGQNNWWVKLLLEGVALLFFSLLLHRLPRARRGMLAVAGGVCLLLCVAIYAVSGMVPVA